MITKFNIFLNENNEEKMTFNEFCDERWDDVVNDYIENMDENEDIDYIDWEEIVSDRYLDYLQE